MRGLRARRPWREDGLWPRARQLELEGVAWHCFWRGFSRGGGSFSWLGGGGGDVQRPRALQNVVTDRIEDMGARDDAMFDRSRLYSCTLSIGPGETFFSNRPTFTFSFRHFPPKFRIAFASKTAK